MAEAKSVSVVPLNGSNYATWKLQCQMALLKEDLWGIVNETETPPGRDAPAGTVTKYRTRKDRALATIVLGIDSSLLYLIGEPEEPVEVWKKLRSQFQKKTWANKLVLRRKLHSLRLKQGEPVQEHIKKMTEIFNELDAIGTKTEEEDRVVQLLASLPESYDTLVTALEANENVPSMEVVIDRLLYEERKSKERHEETMTDHGEALSARSKQKWKRGVRCHQCGKLGHIQKDCYERNERKYEKPKKPHSHKNSNWKKKNENGTSIGLVAVHVLAADGELRNNWIIDSGATCHICCNHAMFDELEDLNTPQIVTLGDGKSIETSKRGTVQLKLKQLDGLYKDGTLHDVLYVPELSYNLLSISKATSYGKTIRFDKSICEILDEDNEVVGLATKLGSLYYLSCEIGDSQKIVNTVKHQSRIKVWHQRYGHLNVSSLRKLANDQLVKGLSSSDVSDEMELCESCAQGKLHRSPFPTTGGNRAKALLELVHSDVCGKINAKSLSGAEYFLTFIDDKTRFVWVYILKHKSQVFQYFKEWKAMVERETGRVLKTLRSDNGGEYTSSEFQLYLKKEGITHEFTVPRSPEQNGVAERLNRTLLEAVRSMLVGAQLSQSFWAEALTTAVYLRNRSLTKSVNGSTPYEAWSGRKPAVNHLKVFGCVTYAHIPKEERRKLDVKAKRCVLLGYGTTVKGYRLYCPQDKKVFYSRDVIFDESKVGLEKEQVDNEADEPCKLVEIDVTNDECQVSQQDAQETVNHDDVPPDNNQVTQDESSENETSLRRSNRERRKPKYYGVWINSTQTTEQYREPTTFEEASTSPEKDQWIEAMEKEMTSLKTNDVYDLVELPKGRKPVGSKWVYKRKLRADGSVERFKSRLVAQGFSQKVGQDYDETFSPVVRFESIRSIIAIAIQNDMLLHQMDVTSAFLNGDLQEEVYMSQPEGFQVKGKEHMVYKLKRSLYGLKQAPRCWNMTLDHLLKKMDFVQTKSDPCLYISSEGELCIIAVYVDDILIATKDKRKLDDVKSKLSAEFAVKDLGDLQYLLGVSITQNSTEKSVWIGQPVYTLNVLEKFGLKDAKPVATPVCVSSKLTKATDDDELVDESLYQSAVGSLQYLSTMTRPDITFAVSNVAKYCSKPTKEHWIAVKRIMRYLKGTHNLGLTYKKSDSNSCVGFSDSDWAGDLDDRKSTSGYIFQVGGTAISWKSRKQSCVALSTAEAEYIALSLAAQEAIWLR